MLLAPTLKCTFGKTSLTPWSASILQSWPARKSRNSYFFSLVAFAMGWEASSVAATHLRA